MVNIPIICIFDANNSLVDSWTSTATAATDWLSSFITFQFITVSAVSLIYRLRLHENHSLFGAIVMQSLTQIKLQEIVL